MTEFCKNLKIEMAKQNLTRKMLSKKAKIKFNTLNGWFSKGLNPDVDKAFKIASALNVSVEYLMTNKKTDKEELKDLIELKNKIKNLLEGE